MSDRIASAVFDSREEAERALADLRSEGINEDAISIIGRHGEQSETRDGIDDDDAGEKAGDTAKAIRTLKGKADSKLKIVVYKTSECANSFKEAATDCADKLKTKCQAFKTPKCLDFNRLSVVVDNKGLIATPANSAYNELVTEAARLSITNNGRNVRIRYGDSAGVEFA